MSKKPPTTICNSKMTKSGNEIKTAARTREMGGHSCLPKPAAFLY